MHTSRCLVWWHTHLHTHCKKFAVAVSESAGALNLGTSKQPTNQPWLLFWTVLVTLRSIVDCQNWQTYITCMPKLITGNNCDRLSCSDMYCKANSLLCMSSHWLGLTRGMPLYCLVMTLCLFPYYIPSSFPNIAKFAMFDSKELHPVLKLLRSTQVTCNCCR